MFREEQPSRFAFVAEELAARGVDLEALTFRSVLAAGGSFHDTWCPRGQAQKSAFTWADLAAGNYELCFNCMRTMRLDSGPRIPEVQLFFEKLLERIEAAEDFKSSLLSGEPDLTTFERFDAVSGKGYELPELPESFVPYAKELLARYAEFFSLKWLTGEARRTFDLAFREYVDTPGDPGDEYTLMWFQDALIDLEAYAFKWLECDFVAPSASKEAPNLRIMNVISRLYFQALSPQRNVKLVNGHLLADAMLAGNHAFSFKVPEPPTSEVLETLNALAPQGLTEEEFFSFYETSFLLETT